MPCPASIPKPIHILSQLQQPFAWVVDIETKGKLHEDVGLEVCLWVGQHKVNGVGMPSLDE